MSPGKENTPEEVARRVAKLEDHVASMHAGEYDDLLPHLARAFSGQKYISLFHQFLSVQDVPYTTDSSQQDGLERTMIATEVPEARDLVERTYRLGSKVLQEVREHDDPTPYMREILRSLAPLSSSEIIPLQDRMSGILSDIFSDTKDNGYMAKAIFNDDLQAFSAYHGVRKLGERSEADLARYKENLSKYLTVAQAFVSKYAGRNLDGDQRGDAVEQFKDAVRMLRAGEDYTNSSLFNSTAISGMPVDVASQVARVGADYRAAAKLAARSAK